MIAEMNVAQHNMINQGLQAHIVTRIGYMRITYYAVMYLMPRQNGKQNATPSSTKR